jgi:hypothetical protein
VNFSYGLYLFLLESNADAACPGCRRAAALDPRMVEAQVYQAMIHAYQGHAAEDARVRLERPAASIRSRRSLTSCRQSRFASSRSSRKRRTLPGTCSSCSRTVRPDCGRLASR